MIKFLSSYVGSKSCWVEKLREFENSDIVEMFAGSSVISANLAKTSILNDSDEFLYKILSKYDELIVPNTFTKEDYFKNRSNKDWWKYAFCFQKMSFSGVFRYSKNGYNVPCKKIEKISVKDEYIKSLNRWLDLKPFVTNFCFFDFPMKNLKNRIVVLDPPYENSNASYNKKFDYHLYWEMVRKIEGISTIILFDDHKNIPFPKYKTREMVVNGKHKGSKEAMFIFKDSLVEGKKGEDFFHELNPLLIRCDGFNFDFKMKNGKTIELKSDYYDMDRTDNFFIERYSYENKPGGPWQALEKGVDFFIYFFPKNKTAFLFKTKELVLELDKIVDENKFIKIGNDGYETTGIRINRSLLDNILIKKKIWK